jgi:hypothetical protein
MNNKKAETAIDFRTGEMPAWVRELLSTHLAIENESAKAAGTLGFMARALVIATMPYKDPKADAFVRQNGDFRLRIVAGYEGGVPFGIYPRLLMSWVATEAVRNQSPVIELGDSLRFFLREILDLRSDGGGSRGSASRVTEQMKRLFGSLITAQYSGGLEKRGFLLKNVLLAEEMELDKRDEDAFNELENPKDPSDENALWAPQAAQEVGRWKSHVRLTESFFKECITNPVPIDLRAYKSLRASPLAMDIYAWLSYRMSYTQSRSKPIRWESLMMQFGTGLSISSIDQAKRDFKKAFLKALKHVLIVYPQANIDIQEDGLVLLPSRPHIVRTQNELF